MSGKAIFGIIAAVLAVSIVGITNLNEDATGMAASRDSKYCCCDIVRYDYYGNPTYQNSNFVRIRSSAYTDEACDMRCDAMYAKQKRDIVGHAC